MLSDITGDGRRPDNSATAILDRRNGDGDVQEGAILTHTYRLVMINTLSLANACHDLHKLILPIWREENRNRLAHDFLSSVPIHALCRRIPTGDDALQIFAKNSIIRRFDNGGHVKKSLGCLLVLGNIMKIRHDGLKIWFLKQISRCGFNPTPGTIVMPHSKSPNLRETGCGKQCVKYLSNRGKIIGMNKSKTIELDKFFWCISQDALDGGTDIGIVALPIREQDHVRAMLNQSTKTLLADL